MEIVNRDRVESFVAPDRAIIRELASPANSNLRRHSLAEVITRPGDACREHYHRESEEVYYVTAGRGRMRLDGQERDIAPGDAVIIPPGVRHKVWNTGHDDLVMLVVCVPAWVPEDSVFTEKEGE